MKSLLKLKRTKTYALVCWWKVSFNLDPSKQTEKVIPKNFKKQAILILNNEEFSQISTQRDLLHVLFT